MFVIALNDPYKKVSHERVAIFLQRYVNAYLDKLDEKLFIKALILVHIPNMNYDSNINNQRPHNKNIFLETLYKNHKEKLISLI